MTPLTTLIPIFLRPADPFWRTAEGFGLLHRFIQISLQAVGKEKLIVATDNLHVLRLAQANGVKSRLTTGTVPADGGGMLPPGSLSSLYIIRDMVIESSHVMILSFTNPLMSPKMIQGAVEQFLRSDTSALITVLRSIDHPCQLDRYFHIEEIAFAHYFDEEGRQRLIPSSHQCPDLFLTKPFSFDWETKGVREPTGQGIYMRSLEDWPATFTPVDEKDDLLSLSMGAPLWIHQDGGTARLLLYSSELRPAAPEPLGAAFSYTDGRISALLTRDGKQGDILSLAFSPDRAGTRYTIKCLPVGTPSGGSDPFQLDVADFSRSVELPWRGDNLQGVLYCLLEEVDDGRYDLMEPFPSENGLWYVREDSKYNSRTGKEIRGRQDFPNVFEPEGSILIAPQDQVKNLAQLITQGRVGGYEIAPEASLHIRCTLDVLRYRAKERIIRSLPESVLLPWSQELQSSFMNVSASNE